MGWRQKSVDCGLEAGVNELWTGGGSQWIVDWRRESVDCGLDNGVRRLWTGRWSQWIVD